MTKYPLIDGLGLEVERMNKRMGDTTFHAGLAAYDVVIAQDLHALLEQAPVVYGEMAHGCPTSFSTTRTPFGLEQATHTALLLNVKPIVRDSFEQLAQDLVEAADKCQVQREHIKLIERARALLAKEECKHNNSSISEPHLAGARRCNDCGAYRPTSSSMWEPK